MPRPITASAALRQHMPRIVRGAGMNTGINRSNIPLANSFTVLQEPHQAGNDFRERSDSVKRKHSGTPTFAEITSSNSSAGTSRGNETSLTMDVVSDVSINIAKVRSILDNAADEIRGSNMDPALISVFGYLFEAVNTINDTQGKIVHGMAGKTNNVQLEQSQPCDNQGFITVGSFPSSDMRSLGAIPKKPRPEVSRVSNTENIFRPRSSSQGRNQPPNGTFRPAAQSLTQRHASQVQGRGGSVRGDDDTFFADPSNDGTDSDKQNVDKKFRSAIRDAERSTLIFNLDMGKVPILNNETINRKATMALATMAAAKEKSRNGIPSQEAVEAIDDVLGATEDMTFFGNGTSTYRHKTDKRSGSFCTVPVCYEFKDRDTRFRAEKILRAKCGVSCATPYPPVVRECIKQIVTETKKEYGNSFVRVTVDTTNMVFKVACKPDEAETPGWLFREDDIPIPVAVRELGTRRVPKGFKLEIAPPKKTEGSTSPVRMEEGGGGEPNSK
jgi:hypothetical protein